MASWRHHQKVKNPEILADFWPGADPLLATSVVPGNANSTPSPPAGSPPPGGSWERQFRPRARFRLRMDETKSVHKAVIRHLYCGPGPAGATRAPKVTIWAPEKQYSGSLAPRQGRIWHPDGTTRKLAAPARTQRSPGPLRPGRRRGTFPEFPESPGARRK
eukprot:gene9113-biopygen158